MTRLEFKTGLCQHCGRACSIGAKQYRSCLMNGSRGRLGKWRPYHEPPGLTKLKLESYDRLLGLWRVMKA